MLGGSVVDPVADLVAAVEDLAIIAKGSTTPDSTHSVAKDVSTPEPAQGANGTCSAKSNDWGAHDEVVEEQQPKNTIGCAV